MRACGEDHMYTKALKIVPCFRDSPLDGVDDVVPVTEKHGRFDDHLVEHHFFVDLLQLYNLV